MKDDIGREKFLLQILFIVALLLFSQKSMSQEHSLINLYDDTSEINMDIETEILTYDENGEITHIAKTAVPRLRVYLPENPTGAALIICPGGGYVRLNVENPKFIANQLTEKGVTVFVLVYRLPASKTNSDKSTEGLQDVQAALDIVHSQADEFHINRDKIGIMGLSAGGHLAAMAATHYTIPFTKPRKLQSYRPDFLILAWPVISFLPDLIHKGSMKNLVGEKRTEGEVNFFSPTQWVNEQTPPTFLVHAGDDLTVPVGNSIIFYEALNKSGVPAELHIYEKGGHGFGLGTDTTNSWISILQKWLEVRKLT